MRMSSESSLPIAVRAVLIVVVIFSLARLFVDGFALEMMDRSPSHGYDFRIDYVAAETIRKGYDVYDSDRFQEVARSSSAWALPDDLMPYISPPLRAFLVLPLSFLPFGWAYRVWVLVILVCLAVSLYLLKRSLPTLGAWAWFLLIIVAANMYSLHYSSDLGQVNPVILLVLCLILFLAKRNQFFWVGVVIAIGTMIKIYPVLLVGYFLLQRQWRVLLGVLVGLALLGALSFAVTAPQTGLSFLSNSLGQGIPMVIDWKNNLSPTSFIHRILTAFGAPSVEVFVRWIFILACLGLAAIASARVVSTSSPRYPILLSIWIVVMLLISPILWDHHLTVLLFVFSSVLAAFSSLEHRAAIWYAIGLGVIYTLLEFENLIMTRGFEDYMFHGNYFHDYFLVDVRLLGLISLFVYLMVLHWHLWNREKSGQLALSSTQSSMMPALE